MRKITFKILFLSLCLIMHYITNAMELAELAKIESIRTTPLMTFEELSMVLENQQINIPEKRPETLLYADYVYMTPITPKYHYKAPKPYICYLCNRSFRLKNDFDYHCQTERHQKNKKYSTIQKSSSTELYKCIVCNKKFDLFNSFYKHQKTQSHLKNTEMLENL